MRGRIFFAALLAMMARAALASDIYWTDDVAGLIMRGDSSGSAPQVLLGPANGVVEPRGIALDVADGKMYWADNGSNSIARANLDGSGAETLISSGLSFPADVELDLVNKKIYWADRDSNWIRRANLDGSGIENVRTGIVQPYFVELDVAAGKVYWSVFDGPSIFSANVDGSGLVETVVSGLDRVRDIGLDSSGRAIYWGDRDTHKIQRRQFDSGG